jgi:hypothetical protein
MARRLRLSNWFMKVLRASFVPEIFAAAIRAGLIDPSIMLMGKAAGISPVRHKAKPRPKAGVKRSQKL